MQKIFYSHRLKSVLKDTVVDLGLTLSMDDASAQMSIRENEAMMRETAMLMRINLEIVENNGSTVAIFSK